LQVRRTVNELSFLADVVVVGVANDTVIEPFAANEQIPSAAHDEIDYTNSRYARTPITVEKVLKGDPPEDLSTALMHSTRRSDGTVARVRIGGGEADLRPCERYVLFLVRGKSIWTGHYIPLGAQGIGVVQGDTVRFETGESIGMDKLISQIRSPAAPPKDRK